MLRNNRPNPVEKSATMLWWIVHQGGTQGVQNDRINIRPTGKQK